VISKTRAKKPCFLHSGLKDVLPKHLYDYFSDSFKEDFSELRLF
jgi:hypothetical protein